MKANRLMTFFGFVLPIYQLMVSQNLKGHWQDPSFWLENEYPWVYMAYLQSPTMFVYV